MGKKCRICNIIEDEKGEYGLLDKPFYKQANYASVVSIPESQYFRRILAEEIGLCGEYSYKENPRVEQSMKVRKMFKE